MCKIKAVKSKMTKVDEYGMTEWKFWSKVLIGFTVLYTWITIASFPLLYVEEGANGQNITTYGEAFWCITMSASTIGFGDHYPVTFYGRVIIAMSFYIGVGLASYIGVTIATALTGFTDQEVQNRELRAQNAQILDDNVILMEDNEVLIEDNKVLKEDNQQLMKNQKELEIKLDLILERV
jgi:voltage-gated potassium channel